jgi:hypothetical protein
MNKILETSLSTAAEVDYFLTLVSLGLCIISSFILKYIYEHKSGSFSSKIHISKIIPLLATITFLVILIVKSSLALSLGLVGALSVIRFRTPIKEPEDLAFLFFAIGLGIGFGALQIYSTTLIFLVLSCMIWFFLSKNEEKISNDYNLIIEANEKENNLVLENFIDVLKEKSVEVEFIKMEKNEKSLVYFFRVKFDNIEEIKFITNELKVNFNSLNFTLYENKFLD